MKAKCMIILKKMVVLLIVNLGHLLIASVFWIYRKVLPNAVTKQVRRYCNAQSCYNNRNFSFVSMVTKIVCRPIFIEADVGEYFLV